METKSILIDDVTILGARIKKGSVLIEDDKIIEVTKKGNSNDADKVIKGEKKVLMPGLVNTHTHLSMTLMRGLADDLPLEIWLNDYIWPLEANLTGEHCYAGAMLGCVEMIKSGTTTFADMYFFMDDVARAVKESGLKCLLNHGMIDLGDEEKRKKEFKESIRIIKKCHNTADGRIKAGFGPHTPYTCSTELLKWVRKKADKYGVKIKIHVGETKSEVQQIMDSYGLRPFEYLEDIGFLGDDVIAAHAVWLSDSEIDMIKKRDVKISHNPVSNMKLAAGISPVRRLLEEGVCVSLGTDGPASNNSHHMFEDMKIASLLQKVSSFDPAVLSAERVFKMATINGAKALGLENEIGTIEVGKKADLVLVNMKVSHLTPFRNPVSHIVYAAEGCDIDTVICNGEILMEDRKLQMLDEAEIIEIAEAASEDLLSRS